MGEGGIRGASAPPLFSEKAVNIITKCTFILGAEYFSPPPIFSMLPPPLPLWGRAEPSNSGFNTMETKDRFTVMLQYSVCKKPLHFCQI